ncbi:hypothetical protein EUX98_g1592 [Antrodiella citrinella]|uniref:Uncharacterized protein n=1 Tax=Antrodiella citrinella TaxID=2447956 RepID=A0A4S4N432_9APHY|nr:hypothetical protein EUX98_g1592 [Antrodiella citrinella]
MTTYQSIVDQTAKSLDVIARLTNELKEMMKTTLEKTKDALRRLDGPSVAQYVRFKSSKPQVVAEAERFITSIAVCVKHFCRELNANAAVIAINVTEEGETQFDLTRKILIVMKEACEAKCQVARAALEQRNMLLFHGAMSLRTTGVKAADVDSESPTPEDPITSTVTPTNAASASTSTSISTSTQMLTTPINLQTQVRPPRPADKTLGSKSGKSSASQLQVSRFKSAEDPELWRLVSDVVVGKLNAQDALFPFSGQDAQHVLDAMQQIVTTSSTRPKSAADTPTARRSLRNLLLKLSLKYHRLPRVLFLQDVQCQSDSSSAGAFADIHRGTHQGTPVGLKRLRIFRNTAVDQKHMSEVINVSRTGNSVT